jgi:hypothetical protein
MDIAEEWQISSVTFTSLNNMEKPYGFIAL